MYVATVFGVMPFKIDRWEFGDTYATLGTLSSPVVTCIFVTASTIFVGTDRGLAIAPRTAANLSAPDPWTTYSVITGISSNSITSLAIFKDTLVVATDQGVAYYVDGSFYVIGSLLGKSVRHLCVDGEQLLILRDEGSGFAIESLTSLIGSSQVVLSNPSLQASSLIASPSLWIGTTSNGIVQQSAPEWDYFYPYGPNSNLFSSIAVDGEGVLWAASGSNVSTGFCRYNPSLPEIAQWKNFSGTEYYRISLGVKGSVWISSWGNGVVEVVGDTIKRRLIQYRTFQELLKIQLMLYLVTLL
jgi:hypothetical protein